MNDALIDLMIRLHTLLQVGLSSEGLPEWGLIAAALLVWFGVERVRATRGQGDPLPPFCALVTLVIGWHWLFAHREALLLHVMAPILLALIADRLAMQWLGSVLKTDEVVSRWRLRIHVLVWGAALLQILGLSDSLLDLADSLSIPVGAHPLSLLKVFQGSLLVLLALLAAIWFSRILERRIMAIHSVDTSLRVAFTKLTQGGLIAASVILTLPLVGIDTTFLSVVGGALGVGLGFGLQKIASNYVSGFIILLDRSVRLNDLVSVDGKKGIVTRMEARFAVLRSADGTEAVIPNETFVTGTVINHTLEDRSGSLSVSWWLAHEADVHEVMRLTLPIPLQFEQVMAKPAPTLQLIEVNDVGVQVQLTWWVFDLGQSDAALKSDILINVRDTLRKSGVPLARRPAYPQ